MTLFQLWNLNVPDCSLVDSDRTDCRCCDQTSQSYRVPFRDRPSLITVFAYTVVSMISSTGPMGVAAIPRAKRMKITTDKMLFFVFMFISFLC
jgi:hypothetical protein